MVAGLEWMVVGETEIFGRVKKALEDLRRLFEHGITV
jgi:glutamyl-tRNA reductase